MLGPCLFEPALRRTEAVGRLLHLQLRCVHALVILDRIRDVELEALKLLLRLAPLGRKYAVLWLSKRRRSLRLRCGLGSAARQPLGEQQIHLRLPQRRLLLLSLPHLEAALLVGQVLRLPYPPERCRKPARQITAELPYLPPDRVRSTVLDSSAQRHVAQQPARAHVLVEVAEGLRQCGTVRFAQRLDHLPSSQHLLVGELLAAR